MTHPRAPMSPQSSANRSSGIRASTAFEQFARAVPVPMALLDRQMRYIAVSQRWLDDYGIDENDIVGRSHAEVFTHLSRAWHENFRRCLYHGETHNQRDRLIKPDGQVDWVEWKIEPWYGDPGEISGAIVIAEIVTVREASAQEQRQQLDEALEQSQQSAYIHQFAIEKAVDAIFWIDPDSKLSYVNEAACQLLEYRRDELLALKLHQIDPAFSPNIWSEHWKAIKQFGSFTFESTHRTKSGRIFPVEVRVNYLKYKHREYHCAFVREITERKQYETALQSANEQLQAVLDAVPGLVSWLSRDLKYLGVNRQLASTFGLRPEDFSNREVGFIESHPGFAEFAREFFESETKTISKEICIGLEGQRRSYLLGAQKYHHNSRAVFVGLDITDRKQMEAQLRRSETLYRTLARNFPNGAVCLFDRDYRYTLAEGTELAKVGLSKAAMEGQTCRDVFDPETAEIIEPLYAKALDGEETVAEIPYAGRIYLTHVLPLKDDTGEVIAGMMMTQNITERKKNEQVLRRSRQRLREQAHRLRDALAELKQTQTQLIQTEKLSSLGQLVAGVAHEINNPVSFIYGNIAHARQYANELLELVELYADAYPEPTEAIAERIETMGLDFVREDFPKLMSSMQVGADRIREVVLSLQNFSRLDQAQKKPVNLHEGIDSTLLILQSRLKAKGGRPGIEVVKDYGDLPKVECYAGQLNQVFMNLLANAIDALEERGIECDASESGEEPTIAIRTRAIAGNRVEIRIADNGLGMTPNVRRKLFEPFFTTKPPGKGTGLGLSISYQVVVQKHGGQLNCDSTPGRGTEFEIVLPIEAK
nr:PAS domain-containing protein [Oxynema sp. CENA135]